MSENNLKICAVICEYNPFHNGHLHQIREIKRLSGCEFLLCVMSGNFVQRGEAAILDKHTRAVHAIKAGADCVIELPLPFAVANAEKFALGAVKILSSIPAVKTLAFGCECGHAQSFLSLARILSEESAPFKAALKEELDTGVSFAKARYNALKKTCPEVDERLYSSPNNVLGLEYTKAILKLNAKIDILPLRRVGAGYTDGALKQNYSSASAIRAALLQKEEKNTVQNNLPDFVFNDLPLFLTREDYEKLDAVERYALTVKKAEEIALTPDCSEGLENRLKSLAKEIFTAEEIITAATSKRYTSARIRRILLANALQITVAHTDRLLLENAYCNVLALNAFNADVVLSLLKESPLPLLVRKGDEKALKGEKKNCYEITAQADELYFTLCGRKLNPFAARFVKD